MDATGIDYGIIVHPEPYQDDHRYLEHCLQVGAGRLKGVALVFADRPGSTAQLPDLVRRTPIVGIRIHAHQADRQPPFGRPELYELWSSASDLGLAVILQFAPPYAGGFEPYVREFADTPVVIDHLGRPNLGTADEFQRVLAFARYPNTFVKYGSLPEPSVFSEQDLRRISDRVVSEWGTDRLIWGGAFDANSTVESYPTMRRRVEALLSNLSDEDLRKVLGANAARLFRFEA
jgi:predicted TIM-barrel fold metal-dependent hydrolase